MFVIGDSLGLHAIARQQFARCSGVFAQDYIGAFEDFERPERNIAQISDWSSDKIKTR